MLIRGQRTIPPAGARKKALMAVCTFYLLNEAAGWSRAQPIFYLRPYNKLVSFDSLADYQSVLADMNEGDNIQEEVLVTYKDIKINWILCLSNCIHCTH